MKSPKCNPAEHTDKPMRRGSKHVRCTKCGDIFPCRHACEHLDCMHARGDKLPAWARVSEIAP